MQVNYAAELERDPKLREQLRQFSKQLGQAIDPDYRPAVRAEWSLAPSEEGRPLYRLALEDPAGRVSADFKPDEFGMALYMSLRLRSLWGDLLHIHSDKQHEKVERVWREFLAEQRELTRHGD